MGKWAQYNKAFQPSWLSEATFKNWLQEFPGNKTKAFCKVCRAEIRAHINDLTKHADSVKHKKNMSAIVPQQATIGKSKVSSFEILLSIYIACHASIRSVDHLTDLIKVQIPGISSIYETIKLHCTKYSALICKAIAPDIFKTIVQDLKWISFSLLINESTDVACIKHLCVCVRYYNLRLNKICTQFRGLIPVSSATAEALY